MSVLLLAISIYCWVNPTGLDFYLRYAISLFSIYSGATNILQTFKLQRWVKTAEHMVKNAAEEVKKAADKISDSLSTDETEKMEASIEGSVAEHIEKRMEPLSRMHSLFSYSSTLSLFLNLVMILLGIMLMVFPFETDAVMMISSGLIMVLTAISDLWTALKCNAFFQAHKHSAASVDTHSQTGQ